MAPYEYLQQQPYYTIIDTGTTNHEGWYTYRVNNWYNGIPVKNKQCEDGWDPDENN